MINKIANTILLLIISVVVVVSASKNHDYEYNSMHQKTYGVDVSFPQHHSKVSTNYDYLPHNDPKKSSPTHPNYVSPPHEYKDMPVQRLGNRQDFYDTFMEGCRHHERSEHAKCDETERDRIDMNLRQPQSMVNYTHLGFEKIKAPTKVFKAIKKFWDDNKGMEDVEEWFTGNTYTNHVSLFCGYLLLYCWLGGYYCFHDVDDTVK